MNVPHDISTAIKFKLENGINIWKSYKINMNKKSFFLYQGHLFTIDP